MRRPVTKMASEQTPSDEGTKGSVSLFSHGSIWVKDVSVTDDFGNIDLQIYLHPDNAYVWARGTGSVPDVPHAANVSFVTEGSGVGVSKEPPVNVKVVNSGSVYGDILTSDSQNAANLCFEICVAEGVMVTWETIFMEDKLYVEVPNTILPEGSKESLVTLLEYAEEELDCGHVILCFKKSRNDRASLIRTFMFLGFTLVTPGDPIAPNVEDLMFLVYTIDNYDTD